MIPETRFVKELKQLDEKLDVGWNDNKDRWQIIYRRRRYKFNGWIAGKALLSTMPKIDIVMTVEEADGGFRRLDSRVIDELNEMDMYKKGNTRDIMREMDDYEDKAKRKREERNSEDIMELTKENYHMIQDALENSRSGRYGT